eukprot:893547-Rhodomonas_salina.1
MRLRQQRCGRERRGTRDRLLDRPDPRVEDVQQQRRRRWGMRGGVGDSDGDAQHVGARGLRGRRPGRRAGGAGGGAGGDRERSAGGGVQGGAAGWRDSRGRERAGVLRGGAERGGLRGAARGRGQLHDSGGTARLWRA